MNYLIKSNLSHIGTSLIDTSNILAIVNGKTDDGKPNAAKLRPFILFRDGQKLPIDNQTFKNFLDIHKNERVQRESESHVQSNLNQ